MSVSISLGVIALSTQLGAFTPAPEPAGFNVLEDHKWLCMEHLRLDGADLTSRIRINGLTNEEYCDCVDKQVRKNVRIVQQSQRGTNVVEPKSVITRRETGRAISSCLVAPTPYSPRGEYR